MSISMYRRTVPVTTKIGIGLMSALASVICRSPFVSPSLIQRLHTCTTLVFSLCDTNTAGEADCAGQGSPSVAYQTTIRCVSRSSESLAL